MVKSNLNNIYKKLIFVSIYSFITIYSKSTEANCEAGGYGIHTKATYKKSDENIYAILRDKVIHINTIDESAEYDKAYNEASIAYQAGGSAEPTEDSDVLLDNFRESLVGKYDVEFRNKRCNTVNIKKVRDGIYNNPQLIISDLFCKKFDSKNSAYIIINKEKKKLIIGERLPIVSSTKSEKPNLQVRNIILNNKFPIDSFYIYSTNAKTIEKDDIVNLSNFPVYITKIGKSFLLMRAELQVNNISKYFVSESKLNDSKEDEYKSYKNKKIKIGYTVLMFSQNGKVKYVGDGSHCASHMIFYKNLKLDNRNKMKRDPTLRIHPVEVAGENEYPLDKQGYYDFGTLDKFKVTNAFDMNGDGNVDIIEVNERFAYRILNGFDFEVINYGWGC